MAVAAAGLGVIKVIMSIIKALKNKKLMGMIKGILGKHPENAIQLKKWLSDPIKRQMIDGDWSNLSQIKNLPASIKTPQNYVDWFKKVFVDYNGKAKDGWYRHREHAIKTYHEMLLSGLQIHNSGKSAEEYFNSQMTQLSGNADMNTRYSGNVSNGTNEVREMRLDVVKQNATSNQTNVKNDVEQNDGEIEQSFIDQALEWIKENPAQAGGYGLGVLGIAWLIKYKVL